MRTVQHFCRFSLACALLGSLLATTGRSEIFLLHDGGRVKGELVNRDQSPRTSYVIKTISGGQVTLEAEQVKEVKRQSAAEIKYDQIRSTYSDTVDAQWKLAEWCRENRLYSQRKVHLERIIELDPNHAPARHALGYGQIHGRWVTQQTLMTENGYQRYKGQWVLPQEIDILERQRKEKLAEADWSNKLKRWHGWLATDKSEAATASIKAINDPFAARALAKYFDSDQSREVRMLYLEALGRINAPAALDHLAAASLADTDGEIRIACLDQVVAHNYKPAVRRYVKALKSTDNVTINRAAYCLSRMKDTSATGPLIDALVTTHTFYIQKGSPGGTSATFGKGPNAGMGGLSVGGGGVETINQTFENPSVLHALVELTGGASFNFDVRAWKYWYAAQRKPQSLDARRDDAAK